MAGTGQEVDIRGVIVPLREIAKYKKLYRSQFADHDPRCDCQYCIMVLDTDIGLAQVRPSLAHVQNIKQKKETSTNRKDNSNKLLGEDIHMKEDQDMDLEKLQAALDELLTFLKVNRKRVHHDLLWITKCRKDELEFIEEYYAVKYQVVPALRSLLKAQVLTIHN